MLKRFLFWFVGLLMVTVGITGIDQWYAERAGTFPMQVDLIRNIRCFVPLMLLLSLWPLAAIYSRTREKPSLFVPTAASAVLLAVGTTMVFRCTAAHSLPTVQPGLMCWLTGKVSCEATKAWQLERDAYDAVREHTTAGDLIAATSNDLAVRMRFYALRSAAASGRDIGVFLYARQAAIPEWLTLIRRGNTIRALKDSDARCFEYLRFARDIGADFALLERRYCPKNRLSPDGKAMEGHELIWRNAAFALVRLE